MTFKRKLTALNYHGRDSFDINNPAHIKLLVVWLEDQKIRHYKIEDREALRNTSSPNWNDTFKQYLKDLGSDLEATPNEIPSTIDWLLGFAVRLEYEENIDKYKTVTADSISSTISAPQVVQQNPLDNLDFDGEEFKAGVATLARLLNIATHPDPLVTIKAVSLFVQERLNKKSIEDIKALHNNKQGFTISYKDSSLGFQTGDNILNNAAEVLRLLHIRDLRELQTSINQLIVFVQSITADPKTDTRLGKVGK